MSVLDNRQYDTEFEREEASRAEAVSREIMERTEREAMAEDVREAQEAVTAGRATEAQENIVKHAFPDTTRPPPERTDTSKRYEPGSTPYEMGWRTEAEYRNAQTYGLDRYGPHEGSRIPEGTLVVKDIYDKPFLRIPPPDEVKTDRGKYAGSTYQDYINYFSPMGKGLRVAAKDYDGREILLKPSTLDEINKAAGDEKFNAMVKAKLIPKGSIYIDENSYLPPSVVAEIKKESPKLGKILETKGYAAYREAYDKAVAEYEKAKETYDAEGRAGGAGASPFGTGLVRLGDGLYIARADYDALTDKQKDIGIKKGFGELITAINKDAYLPDLTGEKVSIPQAIWRFLTPWAEEKGETFVTNLKGVTSRTSSSQAELKQRYAEQKESWEAAPLWAKVLAGGDSGNIRESKVSQKVARAMGAEVPHGLDPKAKVTVYIELRTGMPDFGGVGRIKVGELSAADVVRRAKEYDEFIRNLASKSTANYDKLKQAAAPAQRLTKLVSHEDMGLSPEQFERLIKFRVEQLAKGKTPEEVKKITEAVTKEADNLQKIKLLPSEIKHLQEEAAKAKEVADKLKISRQIAEKQKALELAKRQAEVSKAWAKEMERQGAAADKAIIEFAQKRQTSEALTQELKKAQNAIEEGKLNPQRERLLRERIIEIEKALEFKRNIAIGVVPAGIFTKEQMEQLLGGVNKLSPSEAIKLFNNQQSILPVIASRPDLAAKILSQADAKAKAEALAKIDPALGKALQEGNLTKAQTLALAKIRSLGKTEAETKGLAKMKTEQAKAQPLPQPKPVPKPSTSPTPKPSPAPKYPQPRPESPKPVSPRMPEPISPPKPPKIVKPPDLNIPEPQPPPKLPPRLEISKKDKQDRADVLKAGGAIAWYQGKVGGKDRWDTIINPYSDNSDYRMILGDPPKGATIVARGKGAAFTTAQVLYGNAPKRKVNVDSGFQDIKISPVGRKKIRLNFTPDPEGLTRGDIRIGQPHASITERRARISGRKIRITPPRGKLR